MSILVDKHTKVITQGMTGATDAHDGVRVDGERTNAYFTHNLREFGEGW